MIPVKPASPAHRPKHSSSSTAARESRSKNKSYGRMFVANIIDTFWDSIRHHPVSYLTPATG